MILAASAIEHDSHEWWISLIVIQCIHVLHVLLLATARISRESDKDVFLLSAINV